MWNPGQDFKFATIMIAMLALSACFDDSSGDVADLSRADGLSIDFTNPAATDAIQTPDFVVNITGKVDSAKGVDTVEWKNDRGGKGKANGKENFATGNIVLQLGTNQITVTAEDVDGIAVSKTLTVEREDTTLPGSAPPADAASNVMYSYKNDLSNAAPIQGASLQQRMVHIFVKPGDDWKDKGIDNISILCCMGVSGPGNGENFGSQQTSTSSPWKGSFDLSGLPAGGKRRVQVKASFNDGTASEDINVDFNIEGAASAPNRAPVISGTPQTTATAGNQYSFRPSASDADGDTMTFTIRNKPDWASFNESNGRLYGTPTANHVGNHRDIEIVVSDGKASGKLGPFSINVEAFSDGTALLSWIAPTKRTDNSPLDNLAGFNVYFGQSSKDYANKVKINNPGVATYMLDNLSKGTWYFVVTAYDADGRESNPSVERIKSF